MPLDPREGLFEFREFKGLRNDTDTRDFEPGDMDAALNTDIDNGQNIARRKGFSAPVVAGIDRSLFSAGSVCLGIGSNTLFHIKPDWSTTGLHSGLTPNLPMAYAPIGARVYYTNGAESGAVENGARRTWGLSVPVLGPVVTTGGAFLSGRYQFSMTYLRQDGQESGAALAAVQELTTTGGFALTLPVSTDPTVTRKAVYISARDGEALYLCAILDNSVTAFTVFEPKQLTIALATQFLSAPFAGEHIAYGNGRMLVARGSRLYPSEAYAPELFDLRKGVPFLDRITMVAPLLDGTWLGTDTQVIWLPNAEPEKWEFVVKAQYGVIPYTDTMNNSTAVDPQKGQDPAVFFASTRGLCMGARGGQLINFTDGRFAYPIQPTGTGVVRSHRGTVQYLVTLNGPETVGNVAD